MFDKIKSWFQPPPPLAKVERPKLPDRLGRTEALLDPSDEERGLLYERIYTEIYHRADERPAREQIVRDHGYDPDTLSELGSSIRERCRQLMVTVEGKGGSTQERQEYRDLSSLVYTSKIGQRHKEHISLSIGLAAQLRRQMRKLLKAELVIDEDRKVAVMGEEASSYRREDLLALDVLLQNNQPAVEGRFSELLVGLSEQKQKQYQCAWGLLYGELKGGRNIV